MFRVILSCIVVLNMSSATLNNALLVFEDNCIEIGTIRQGESCKIKSPTQDSIRVIFTLEQKREGWLGTDKIPIRDTIKIDDKTNIFELEVEQF